MDGCGEGVLGARRAWPREFRGMSLFENIVVLEYLNTVVTKERVFFL